MTDIFRRESARHDTEDNLSKRISNVDTLQKNKDKKLFFNTIDNSEEYYPFGTPGGGAPLRDSKNDLLSRLPNVQNTLWNPNEKERPISIEAKKQEIHSIIDKFTKKKPEEIPFDPSNDPFFAERRIKYAQQQLRLDPVTRSHIKPDSYWNDWFGRPGAGAPNRQYANKQNLSEMLEPGNHLFFTKTIDTIEPYSPKNLISRKYRSDHHNRYELTPR